MKPEIEETLQKLPQKPGVYLMRDARDVVLYVGKAKSLRNRVRQYFQSSRKKRLKIYSMIPQVDHIETIVTDSEVEALVLECNLIKEYRPKYNTMLMDDKAYPFIKVTVQDAFPRLVYAHHMRKDGARYFGPFPNAGAVKETIDLLRRLYRLRACNRNLPRDIGKERACLYHHIHQCDAPCQGLISEAEYAQRLAGAIDFLQGKTQGEIRRLTDEMQEAAEAMDYERAAACRDLIASIRKVAEHQKMSNTSEDDQDVIALAREEGDAIAQVFFVRAGKLIGREHFYVKADPIETRGEILASFIKQYYAGTPFIPRELMLSDEIEEAELVESWLTEKRGRRVYVRTPQRGTKEKLVELAAKNAGLLLAQDRERIKREVTRTIGAARQIGSWLGMEMPARIEAYDISNISGFQSVGSMVVYEKGRPKRADYRKFRIKSVEGPNDYASMEEVLTRRFVRGTGGDHGFDRLPDLIMMDGGKGQVNIALDVLETLGLEIPVCGMVKDDRHRTRGLYFQNEEIPIDTSSEGFHLITRIQDEAHRFAIEYHRSLRSKEQTHSVLDDIPLIGPARRRELMRHFENIDALRAASEEEIASLPGMNARAAASVYAFFHEEGVSDERESRPADQTGGGDEAQARDA